MTSPPSSLAAAMSPQRSAARQRGFTLVEVVIFIVVVGLGVAGILSVFQTVVKSSADPMVRKQALAIAESLLEEIVLQQYCDPDTRQADGSCGSAQTEASRSLFDDVEDYHNYTSASIVDATGTTATGLSGYRIEPAVAVSATTLHGVAMKKIVVSVTSPQGPIRLTGYRADN